MQVFSCRVGCLLPLTDCSFFCCYLVCSPPYSLFVFFLYAGGTATRSGEMETGTGDLQMVLMGLEQGTLGVAKLCTGHLVCVYAEVEWGGVVVIVLL